MNGLADLLVPVLVLVVGGWLAFRGGGNPVGSYLAQREALRPQVPQVSAEARRAVNPWELRPRANEWVDGELMPDPQRAALEALQVIEVQARDVEPVTAPPRRPALSRPRPAIEPGRRAIGPGPSTPSPGGGHGGRGDREDRGAVEVRAALVWVCGVASLVVVLAELMGRA